MTTASADRALGPPLLGALMRLPWEALQRRIFAEVQAAGFTDVSPAHLSVLRWPGPQGCRPSELAAQLGVTKQALNYLLGQLDAAGYLERRGTSTDRRTRTIELTPLGLELAHVMRDAVTAVERDIEQELGRADLGQLRDLLRRLNATHFVQDASAPAAAAVDARP
jgi:DNA-binding MarR family transcriptional regulator